MLRTEWPVETPADTSQPHAEGDSLASGDPCRPDATALGRRWRGQLDSPSTPACAIIVISKRQEEDTLIGMQETRWQYPPEQGFLLFFFSTVAKFNILNIRTLVVHAGLLWCFPNPPNSDMYRRIFNVCMSSFCMRIHTRGLGLWSHPKDFCRICIEFDSREISGRAQSLACNGQPTIW